MSAIRNKIEKNLLHIREEIAAACKRSRRSVGEVQIVAVTKSADLEGIRAAVDLGLTELAENRVQQLLERSAELSEALAKKRNGGPRGGDVHWHMIGHLQRNKVKAVLDTGVTMIHSVDSLRLAEEINARAERMEKTIDVLLQVNCSQELQKFGVAVGAASYLGEMITTLKNVRLAGLMTIGPLVENLSDARPAFSRLRELFDEMRHEGIGGPAFKHLSMGMSQDFPVAIEEGATLLRIGRGLFE